jgi:hypothetical protein
MEVFFEKKQRPVLDAVGVPAGDLCLEPLEHLGFGKRASG